MDPTNLVALAFVALALWLVTRPIIESVGSAGDVLAALFVPPNLALGWPHGVQESDAPWGWRSPSEEINAAGAVGRSDWAALEPLDTDQLPAIRAGSFVVPIQRVRRRRPH